MHRTRVGFPTISNTYCRPEVASRWPDSATLLVTRHFMGRRIVALSFVMTVMVIAELRKPVSASSVHLPELTLADRAIALFALGMFTLAIVNGLILVAAKTLP